MTNYKNSESCKYIVLLLSYVGVKSELNTLVIISLFAKWLDWRMMWLWILEIPITPHHRFPVDES